MDSQDLRDRQAPLEQRYRDDPTSARVTLKARGRVDLGRLTCQVDGGRPEIVAGLHPMAGGPEGLACS